MSTRFDRDSLFFIRLLKLVLLLSFAQLSYANAFVESLTNEEQTWIKAHPKVTIAFDGHFPPYSFVNDQGKIEGFSVDVIHKIEDKIGITFVTAPQTEWPDVYRSAIDHNVDVVANIVERSVRQEWLSFTDPYIYKSLIIVVAEDNNDIRVRNDIDGQTVAFVKDYYFNQEVLQEFPSITPVYVDNLQDALYEVSVGNVDATISFLGGAHYYRNRLLLSNLKYGAIFDKKHSNSSISVRNDWPELTSIINKALRSIPEAEMHAMRAKWLPVDYMRNLVELSLTPTELQWLKDNPVVTLGVDPEFAPFEYIEGGIYKGIASDYIQLLEQRLNIKMNVAPNLTWSEVIEKTKQGEIDVLPAVGKSKERETYLSYTEPYLDFHRVIVTRDDSGFVSGLEDIAHLDIAVQKDSSHQGYINEQTNIDPQLFGTLRESLLALSGGEVDAFVGNVAASSYWIRKLHLTNLKIAAPVSNETQRLHFAVKHDKSVFAGILQKGLDSISPQEKKLITSRWLSVKYDPKVDYTIIINIVLAAALLVLLVAAWNLMLKRKLRAHEEKLNHSFNYDQLTGLPNRFLVLDRLSQRILTAKRNRRKVALLSVNIDNFKKINNVFDHRVGDKVLTEFALRLKKTVTGGEIVGRLSGDQFLIAQGDLREAVDCVPLMEQVIACTHESFIIEDTDVSLTLSLGVALYPEDGKEASLLLKHAGSAMHFAKKKVHGNYAFYTDNLIQGVSRRIDIESALVSAIAHKELEVYYQPKIDTVTQRIQGVEALLRWNSRALGWVSPEEFIPIAENTGMIHEIGDFVLKEALEQLTHWHHTYDTALTMAINVSPVQFRSDGFINRLTQCLDIYAIDKAHVEIEITEGVLLADVELVEARIQKLHDLGICLSMDDFGKGYSSLCYLRKYQFEVLKIDREFISHLEDSESDKKLVEGTIAMAHALGIKIVAEGVETEAQKDILTSYGCDTLQGWLYSKAISANDMDQFIIDYKGQ